MCFSIRKQGSLEHFEIKIRNEEIEEVNDFKFLGIILDPQLKFDKHVKKISKTVKTNLNCFKLIRHYIPTQAAQLFMHAMIFSHFSYCMTVWTQALPSTIRHLTSLYNQPLKIMDKKPVRWHHCHILKKYNLLSFESFTHFCFLKLVFKCINSLAPKPLSRYMQRQESARVTRSMVNGNCEISYRRSKFGQSAFSIQGCQLWNTLPTEIKLIPDIKSFTTKVKCWLKANQSCTHF